MYSSVSCTQVAVLAPEEGIYLSLKALLSPSDHVVVTYPGYQSLYEVARSIGCTVSHWQPQRQAQGHWSFDPEDLRSIMQSDTKVCRCPLTCQTVAEANLTFNMSACLLFSK